MAEPPKSGFPRDTFTLCWGVLLALLSVALVYELYYFRVQAALLVQQREDYSAYVDALKRMIEERGRGTESGEEEETACAADQKKKPSLPSGVTVMLNRDRHYLREEARLFARLQGCEDATVALYGRERGAFISATPSTQRARVRRRVQRTQPVASANKRSVSRSPAIPIKEPLFIIPIEEGRYWLSSPFGPRRLPDGKWGFHHGIDLAALKGTPIKAAAAGVVIEAQITPGYGKTVVISHDKRYKTRYAHLNTFSTIVGQRVKQGQMIGRVGDTGLVRKKGRDASHLHFEVSVHGARVNPFSYLKKS